MSQKLVGKTVLVTGGGRGIGEAICRRFALEGATVAVADIDAETAETTSANLSIPGLPIEMDVQQMNMGDVIDIYPYEGKACRHGESDALTTFKSDSTGRY